MILSLITIDIALFLVVDGIMLIRGRGLVDRLPPVSMPESTRRWISASVYFGTSAYLLVLVVRG